MKRILVTDSLFIFDEHMDQLEKAGYQVERLDKPKATEDELIEALRDKQGYVLGGIEKVTAKVIEASQYLEAIAFTGADWKALIPGWEAARNKGVKIANAPGSNAQAVAEFALGVALAMQRNLFELGRTGEKTFQTTGTFQEATVGVVGAGNIGSKIINAVGALEPKKVQYHSRTSKDVSAEYSDFETLLKTSDIIFVAVPGNAGELFDLQMLEEVKDGALIVSVSPLSVFDLDALLTKLQQSELRAAIDWPVPTKEFLNLPLSTWFNTNDHSAYNTHIALKKGSDMATQSLINLLETGEDEYRVI